MTSHARFVNATVRTSAAFELRSPFREADVRLMTLSNYNAVVAEALRTGYIQESDIEMLSEWRKAPEKW